MGLEVEQNGKISVDEKISKKLIWRHPCNSAVMFTVTGTDANAAGTIGAESGYFETNGLTIFSGDADPLNNDYVLATKRICLPVGDISIVRMRFGIPDISLLQYVEVIYKVERDTREYYFVMYIQPNVPRVSYETALGVYTEVPELSLAITDGFWTNLEMVCDVKNGKMLQMEMYGIKVDLNRVSVYDVGAVVEQKSEIAIMGRISGAAAAKLYVDEIVIFEPEMV